MNSKPAASSQQPVARKSRIAFLLQAKRYKLQAGFTLIEMLVGIAVMAIVTGVMLANNGRFGGQVLLQNLAYDIALTLRHAQVYGISVLRFEDTASYAPGYGIHFLTSGPGNIFILFGDRDNSKTYSSDEAVEGKDYTIRSGYRISELRVFVDGTARPNVSQLDVVFSRPEPDAYIRSGSDVYDMACIAVTSPKGDVRYVVVQLNGQISVQNEC